MSYEKMRGLALGILLGFLLSTGALWVLSSSHRVVVEHLATHLSNFVIVAAAALGLWGVSRQIQSNVDLAEKTRMAKLEAAKSCLPLVLSRICEICEERQRVVIHGDDIAPDQFLTLSSEDFETLRACIEFSPRDAKRHLSKMIAVYQILVSRWRIVPRYNLFTDHSDERELDRLQQYYQLQNWFALDALASVAFSFARGGEFPQKENLINKMRNAVIWGMYRVSSAISSEEGGRALSGREDYQVFLDRMESGQIHFIDKDIDF